ncbi:MAG TPA: TMEM165/GDT1 family protein [Actinobacteria bacterium]|nr:TMEM165/GDT1 family protein [Actinomycetota bacterium]
MGDKTQLAVIAFAAESDRPWIVFLAASAALVSSTGLAVVLGGALSRVVPAAWLQVVAATAFVVIGLFLLREALPEALGR